MIKSVRPISASEAFQSRCRDWVVGEPKIQK